MTSSVNPAKNVFVSLSPLVAYAVIAIPLIAMASFGSTERLAAALAWMIFVAVLFADGSKAFTNITNINAGTPTTVVPPTGLLNNGTGGIA